MATLDSEKKRPVGGRLHATVGRRVRARVASLVGLSFAALAVLAAETKTPPTDLEKGVELFKQGRYEQALPVFQNALEKSGKQRDAAGQVEAALGLAAARQTLGQYCEAIEILERALAVAEQAKSKRLTMMTKAALGNTCSFSRRLKQADTNLREGLALARELRDVEAQAGILQNLGNLLVAQRQPPPEMSPGGPVRAMRAEIPHPVFFPEGMQLYDEALALLQTREDPLPRAKITLNKACGCFLHGDYPLARTNGMEVWNVLESLPASREKSFLTVAAGHLFAELAEAVPAESATLTLQAYRAFTVAEKLAVDMDDTRTASYAIGYLGRLYEKEKRWHEAMILTQQALLGAQKAGCPEAQFEWEWQMARLLRDQDKPEPALAAYRRALQTLRSIRSDLSLSVGMRADGRSFRESTGQVYFELADLLLRQADRASDAKTVAGSLLEARNTIELFKSVEIEDYFYEDDCASLLGAKAKPIENLVDRAAVIYIIPLADRTELLLTLPGGLNRFKSPVNAGDLGFTVRQFRLALQNPESNSHLDLANRLWRWLIQPLEETLDRERVETLIFVPDGALRTVPMAALHDGTKYLVERYAVAVSPGLSLMEPKPIARARMEMLACGISTSVQGYPALEAVSRELSNLNSICTGKILLNKEFVLDNFQRELASGRYSMVHIASHGEFGSDVSRTFVLSYDTRLTMDRLEAMILPFLFSDRAIELLTLSACQTSAGDDRAALGLAGVALKAGARSALASLWSIHDEATERVMSEFYRQLKSRPDITKAQALQQAQLSLRRDPQYRHPAFWAPFLIIGNWL